MFDVSSRKRGQCGNLFGNTPSNHRRAFSRTMSVAPMRRNLNTCVVSACALWRQTASDQQMPLGFGIPALMLDYCTPSRKDHAIGVPIPVSLCDLSCQFGSALVARIHEVFASTVRAPSADWYRPAMGHAFTVGGGHWGHMALATGSRDMP